MSLRLIDKLNNFPPCFCRYVARTTNGRRGLTTRELARASGLATTTIKELSYRSAWNSITIEAADNFMTACGVNPLAARKHRDFLKRRKMVHVSKSRGAQRKMYDRIERLIVTEAQKRKTNQL